MANSKLVSGAVRKLLFSVVKREFSRGHYNIKSAFFCFEAVARGLDYR